MIKANCQSGRQPHQEGLRALRGRGAPPRGGDWQVDAREPSPPHDQGELPALAGDQAQAWPPHAEGSAWGQPEDQDQRPDMSQAEPLPFLRSDGTGTGLRPSLSNSLLSFAAEQMSMAGQRPLLIGLRRSFVGSFSFAQAVANGGLRSLDFQFYYSTMKLIIKAVYALAFLAN